MKQVGYTHLEIEKKDNLYSFSMPMGGSLAEAADAAFIFFKSIDKAYREIADKEIKEKEKELKEESKEN